MAAVAAQTVVDRWNTHRATLGYIPALLNGSVTAATIPGVGHMGAVIKIGAAADPTTALLTPFDAALP